MAKFSKLLFVLLILSLSHTSWAKDYILVVNKENPIHTMTRSDVKKVFLGKKSFWDNGHRIDVFLQTEAELHAEFISDVMKKTPRQFSMYWRRELYSGTGLPPQKLDSDQAIKAEIAANPRAISYISADSIDDTVKRVRIID